MRYSESYRVSLGFEFPPLHDPSTVAYVVDSSIFEG